jgi:hypothetical protein
VKDSEQVQKKLQRFTEDMQRNIEKSKKKREELKIQVNKLKREYELKRENQQ